MLNSASVSMPNEREVSVEVMVKPGDVYGLYLWSWPSLLRRVVALLFCFALYDVCFAPAAPVKGFSDAGSISAVLVTLVVFIVLGLHLFPYLRLRSTFRKSPGFKRSCRVMFSPD